MTKNGIRLTFLVVAFALGALPPQFAQEGPKELPDQHSSLHSLMRGLIRTINTAEVTAYASWKTLLENHEQQQYLNGWPAQFYAQAAKTGFGSPPEVLPGLNLRLNIAPDGGVTSSSWKMRTITPDLLWSATKGASSDIASSFVE